MPKFWTIVMSAPHVHGRVRHSCLQIISIIGHIGNISLDVGRIIWLILYKIAQNHQFDMIFPIYGATTSIWNHSFLSF